LGFFENKPIGKKPKKGDRMNTREKIFVSFRKEIWIKGLRLIVRSIGLWSAKRGQGRPCEEFS